jgi:hypothetical protein
MEPVFVRPALGTYRATNDNSMSPFEVDCAKMRKQVRRFPGPQACPKDAGIE